MTLRNVWRLMSYHIIADKEAALRWSGKNERLAIGWDTIGDIREHNYASSEEVADAIRLQFALGNHPYANYKSGGDSLWALYREMKIGALVVLKGEKSALIFRVDGDYEFRNQISQAPFSGYFHQRRAASEPHMNPHKLWQASGGMVNDGGSIYRTLIRCAKQV